MIHDGFHPKLMLLLPQTFDEGRRLSLLLPWHLQAIKTGERTLIIVSFAGLEGKGEISCNSDKCIQTKIKKI